MTQDSAWDDLSARCERLAEEYDPGRVEPAERLRGIWIVAGIEAPQFAVFEPVMRRRPFSRNWEQLVPLQEAASRTEAVLREGT